MGRFFNVRVVFALAIAGLLGNTAVAQTVWDWTSAIEYDFGVPLEIERRLEKLSWCDCPATGTSSNHTLTLAAGVRARNLFGGGVGLTLRTAAGFSTGHFRSDQYETVPFFDPVLNRVITALARFDVRANTPLLRLDAFASLALTEFVALDAGPWLAYRLDGSFSQNEILLAPDHVTFPENGRPERVLAEGQSIAGRALRGGLAASFRFASPLAESIDLAWDLRVRADAAALSNGLGVRALSVGAGLSLSFNGTAPAFIQTELSDIPAVTVDTHTTAPVDKRLEATISLFSTGPDGERIGYALVRTAQHYYRQNVPLLPTVYFEKNSAQIPGRYVQISRSARFSFSTRRLIRLSAAEQYYQLLNLVGLRMTEHPSATITLLGAASPDEPASIAMARAEAVQLYLQTIWDVHPSRLRLETHTMRPQKYTAAAQFRSVEIRSTSRDLLAPLATDWMVENFITTPINLDPAIRNPGAARDWTITIAHKGKEIARYSSDDQELDHDLDIGLLFGESEEANIAPLSARFDVTDSTGSIVSASDALSFLFSGDSTGGRDVDILTTTTYVMRGTDLSTSPEGKVNRDLLRDLANRMNDGDRVIIRPVLEPSGAAAVTTERVRQEVQHVANAMLIELGKKHVAITVQRGADAPVRDRDAAELDMLSTLIAITLERDLGTATATAR